MRKSESGIRGLARLVQVRDNDGGREREGRRARTLVDLTLSGVLAGVWHATVRANGDISRGAASTGAVWETGESASKTDDRRPRGYLGQVEVAEDGKGSAFLDRDVAVSDIIGRAMVVSRERPETAGEMPFVEDDGRTVVGVIARSAGVWDNEKTVCSCSGKTVWEERTEQVGKGMI